MWKSQENIRESMKLIEKLQKIIRKSSKHWKQQSAAFGRTPRGRALRTHRTKPFKEVVLCENLKQKFLRGHPPQRKFCKRKFSHVYTHARLFSQPIGHPLTHTKTQKCSRNGSPWLQNQHKAQRFAAFFEIKLVLACVRAKTLIFDKLWKIVFFDVFLWFLYGFGGVQWAMIGIRHALPHRIKKTDARSEPVILI